MRAYDSTGKAVEVSEAEFPDLFARGVVGLPAGSTIPIDTEDGPKAVPIEQAAQHLAKPGVTVLSPEAFERHQLQEKYGGIGQQAITGAENLIGGATLGAGTAIEGAFLGNQADILARQKANPVTSAASQIAGALIPTVLAPETGAGEAEEATLLGRLSGGAADVIGAPSRGLARAGGAVEDFMAHALGASESDSFAAAIAKNVAAKGAAGAFEGATIGAAQHLTEESIGDPDANGESLYAAMGHGALLGLALGGTLGAGGELGSRALGRLSPHMQRLAETQAARAVGLTDRAIGRRLLEDEAIGMGEGPEQMLPKVQKAAKAADDRVRASLEVADRAGAETPDVEDLLKVAGKNEQAVRAVEALTGIPSIEEAAAKGLDRDAMMFSAKIPLASVNDLNRSPAMRGMFQRELDAAADRAARKLGGSFEAEYRDARIAQSQYGEVLPALAKRAIRASESGVGLPALGLLAHGPVGAAGGLALAMAKRAAIERGAGTSAVILDKLASLRAVERARQIMERQVERGLSGALGTGDRAALRVKLPIDASYEERVAAVQKAVQGGAATAEKAIADVADHAPRAARSFQATANRATQYLATLIPKTKHPPSITPQFDRPHMATRMEQATFNRAFDVMHDPVVALKAAQDGRLTKDHVKALAAGYPTVYAQIVQQAHARLADLKHPLNWKQKSQLQTLLGIAPDPELTRHFQATYAGLAPPPPSGPQQKQHANKPPVYHGPKRPITAPAKNAALDQGEGRPVGS